MVLRIEAAESLVQTDRKLRLQLEKEIYIMSETQPKFCPQPMNAVNEVR